MDHKGACRQFHGMQLTVAGEHQRLRPQHIAAQTDAHCRQPRPNQTATDRTFVVAVQLQLRAVFWSASSALTCCWAGWC